MGVEEAYRWKDSVQAEAEVRIWAADGIANGLRPWFTKFSGTLHDRRWLGVVEDLYTWCHHIETYLRNEAPLARVGLVYSHKEDPPADVKGPGVLDVSVWRQQRSMTVHLVNLTNPMMMKGPFRELIPVGEQQVEVRLPAGARARRVQLLSDGRVLPVPLDGAQISLKVPSIRDHEIVAIDLES